MSKLNPDPNLSRLVDVSRAAQSIGLPYPTQLTADLHRHCATDARIAQLLRVCVRSLASGDPFTRFTFFQWNGQPCRVSCGPGPTFKPTLTIEITT